MPRETAAQQQERLEAKARLLRYLKPGDNLYTINSNRARSGMSRSVVVLIGVIDERTGRPEITDISSDVARALGETFDRDHGGVKVRGCGMNMHWFIVSNLAHVLWGNSVALNQISL